MDIALLRKALGLSQLEFGQLLGVHLMTVSKWERGITRPSAYQDALLQEFRRAAAGAEEIGTKIKARLAGRGVAAALRFLLAAAAREEEEDMDAPGAR